MKKSLFTLMCLAMVMAVSLSAKAQEITINLMPGWTWISYPKAEVMDLANAFGDFTPVEGDMVKSQFGFSIYENGRWAGSLTQFTPGMGYKYYSNRTELVSFVFGSTSSHLTVTTAEPLLITTVSAMSGGEVTTNDGTYILMKGLCWAAHENPTTNNDFYQEAGSGVGSFTISMTGLNIGTTYYVRAYAVTPYGTVYGNQKIFITLSGIPVVSTDSVTNILGNSATCFGTVTDNGGLDIIARGFCWGTESNPTIEGSHTTEEPELGSFSSNMTDLIPDAVYYVRAYATTEYATAYGEEITFTTLNGVPEVSTDSVTNILGNGATCFGTVTDNGGLDIIARGICWSAEPNPTIEGSHTAEEPDMGSFSSSLTGLMPNTTYYVRAYATTTQTTSYGEEMTFTTMSGIPQVSTAEVTDITGNTATSGGTVTSDGGLDIIARGVCWSTTHNPTLSDSHTADGTGTGSFSSSLAGLSPNTTYYVRAYATNSYVTMYGNEMSFTTLEHAYVDLGLPSGLLWATCNVGAETPEDYGDYFAWGETQPKEIYNWNTYQYCNDSANTLTKYCNNSNYGYNGFTDNLITLQPEDDAATANWGPDWRTPTKEEWEELLNYTTNTWITQNGVSGSLFTANNGNSLFLPATGYFRDSTLRYEGSVGFYWSSSRYEADKVREFVIRATSCSFGASNRYVGQPARAVYSVATSAPYIINAIANPAGGGTVSNTQQGNVCTLTATADEDHVFTNWTENGEVVSTDTTYSFTVTENRILMANFIVSAPTGAIPGKFTINNSGDKVFFSQGNLQYIGSASTPYWKFAENQWDYLGETTGQNSSNQYVDRDLFGWCTSGYNHGAVCYQPWSTSTSYSDYYAYGSYTYNLNDQTGLADWGYNPISNGGNQPNQWRTLTTDEWGYVFDTRSTSSGMRYAKACVNNVNGVILLPDDWNNSYFSLSSTNTTSASFSSNAITSAQWNMLEQHGAVFLPAAGYRNGTSVHLVGSNGFYWSALYNGSEYALYVRFYDTHLFTPGSVHRYFGQSVRLVCPAEN